MAYDHNCNKCHYLQQNHLPRNQRTNRVNPPVELEANNSNTLLVFQAPGVEEWKVGRPIQPTIKVGGTAGRRIELSWKRSNKRRQDFDIINSVQCFPGTEETRDAPPNTIAICLCSKRLESILSQIEYENIVVFGDIAEQAIRSICNILSISPNIISARHPNGGVFRRELDDVWKNCQQVNKSDR